MRSIVVFLAVMVTLVGCTPREVEIDDSNGIEMPKPGVDDRGRIDSMKREMNKARLLKRDSIQR